MELTTLELKNIEAKFMNIFERLEILEQKEPTAITVDSKGINSTELFYLATNSIKSPSENDERWSINIPGLGNGDFLWEKIVTTYADEKSVEIILGAKM